MTLSVASLAQQLDALDLGAAFVTEGEDVVTVSNVPTVDALDLGRRCRDIGWVVRVEDREENAWPLDDLDDEYAPFTVVINKPVGPAGVLRLLTNVGLAEWLERDDGRRIWQVARLETAFRTYAVTFAPWDAVGPPPYAGNESRSARRLVREVAGIRAVPESVNRWLLADKNVFPGDAAAARTWGEIAARRLMLVLPNEVDGEQHLLRFKGPPRLDLRLAVPGLDVLPVLTLDGFLALQKAVDWVFELEREAEMRHILLAAEFARSGGSGDAAPEFVRDNVADALAGAKTAYQVQLSGISSDALKTLSELRKSVSDDTAKVAEGTRQIITAVAGALAIGVGLVAARLSGTVDPTLIKIILLLAATYVAITILSGVSFTFLQRKVRKAWQPRLYRFLTSTDYDALVGGPARTAERALWGASVLGLVAIALMVVGFFNIKATKSFAEPAEGRNESAAAVDDASETVDVAAGQRPTVSTSGNEIAAGADTSATGNAASVDAVEESATNSR